MSRKVVSEITITLLLASMLSVSMTSVAKAEETVVAVDSPAVTVTVGQTFQINVTVTNVIGMVAWGVNMSWDPNIIQITTGDPDPNAWGAIEKGKYNIYEGPFLKRIRGTIFTANRIDNKRGEIEKLVCAYADSGVGASGDGVLATINFTSVNVGTTTIDINGPSPKYPGQSLLLDSTGKEIPHEDRDGTVTVITVEALSVTINFHPGTLNLLSKGKWITAYIELPEGYNVSYIDASTIMLSDTIPAESYPVDIGDEDGDGIPDLMVKFSRYEVIGYILGNIDIEVLVETRMTPYGRMVMLMPSRFEAKLTVTGNLFDGTPFEGSDTIRVLFSINLFVFYSRT